MDAENTPPKDAFVVQNSSRRFVSLVFGGEREGSMRHFFQIPPGQFYWCNADQTAYASVGMCISQKIAVIGYSIPRVGRITISDECANEDMVCSLPREWYGLKQTSRGILSYLLSFASGALGAIIFAAAFPHLRK